MTRAKTGFDIHVPFVEHMGLQLLEKNNGTVRMRMDPNPEFENTSSLLNLLTLSLY